MSGNRVGQGRDFLNLDYMTSLSSNIGYEVVTSTYNDTLKEEGLVDRANIRFNISDCNKQIHLDLDVNTKEEMRNSLHKLRVIINHCEELMEALKVARKHVLVGKKRLEELK